MNTSNDATGSSYSKSVSDKGGVRTETVSYTQSDGSTVTKTTITRADGTVITSDGGTAPTRRTVQQSFAAADVQRVEARSDYGTISVGRAPHPGQVEVSADITISDSRISATDAKRYAAAFTIEGNSDGGALKVSAKAPTDYPKGVGFNVSYTIGVPEGMGLKLHTDNGQVKVHGTGATGVVAADSSYGTIEIVDSGSSVNATTSNGAVTVRNNAPMTEVIAKSDYGTISVHADAAKVTATTSNGTVSVVGAAHARAITVRSDYGSLNVAGCGGTIDMTTSNGSAVYDGSAGGAPTTLDCSSDYGSIKAILGDTSVLAHASLKTSNGSVRLEAPATASVAVSASTSNGSISVGDFGGTVAKDGGFGRTFDSARNGGRSTVTMQSDYGSIEIGVR